MQSVDFQVFNALIYQNAPHAHLLFPKMLVQTKHHLKMEYVVEMKSVAILSMTSVPVIQVLELVVVNHFLLCLANQIAKLVKDAAMIVLTCVDLINYNALMVTSVQR